MLAGRTLGWELFLYNKISEPDLRTEIESGYSRPLAETTLNVEVSRKARRTHLGLALLLRQGRSYV